LGTCNVDSTKTSKGVIITSCSKYIAAVHPGKTP